MSGQFDSHLPWIKAELAANPTAALALSIGQLRHAALSHEMGLDLIEEFAQAIEVEALEIPVADDIRLFRDALGILDGRTPILGMGYFNFTLNVRDCGWQLSTFVSEQLGLDMVARIVAANPRLGRIIADRPALVPF
ncbi:hypothetical protein [Pseudarthrobacter sp. AB1]|uniref:hypothetical protein n=1 Tax=Pseudarthrobacter sp. AB1 TaxID=2138309 RepID=UPI00186B5B8F|nr:hypothetical protein [Pseudarthrobacter sp. AB1]MBE4720497.1 hypothetical protein [Pseudarthrobacter sp. AB1]